MKTAVDNNRKAGSLNQMRAGLAALLAVLGAAFALPSLPSHADPVAADGAVGVNINWENGTSSEWFVELQRQGIYSIDTGIQAEDDAEIRQGLLEFDWAFKHQAADGSFAGTAGGSIGQEFHSTSLFLEAAARATIELKSYSPTTYTLDTSFYNAKIAAYTADIKACGNWYITPSVAAAGQAYNQPYTHRRYLLAATLSQAGALCNDSAFTSAALPYAEDGISRQLGTGWTAAIPNAVNGVYPAAVLLAPGAPTPSGTYKVISAVGVDPEVNGYDSEYQCTGLFYANVYYKYCTNSTVKSELVTAINAGLKWEQQFVDPFGNISITGDSRMGIEKDRSGVTKTPDVGIIWGAFLWGYHTTGTATQETFANRLANQDENPDSNTVYSYGAVDGNEAWEHNKSLPWNIGSQRIAVDYVEQGIACENDAQIQKGLLIFNWGFIHMNPAGYFKGSSSIYYGTGCFIEAAARAANDLKSYKPVTYTPTTNYSAWASATLTQCVTCCNWISSPSVESRYLQGISTDTSHLWAVAAALAATGDYANMDSFQSTALPIAADAVALQLSSGEDPENGAADVNYQVIGLGYALHFAATSDDIASVEAADDAANLGLIWEGKYINPDGSISGTSSAALQPMRRTLYLAASLPDADYFAILSARLGGTPVE